MGATDTHGAIDAVWRIEAARLIAGLARMVGDVARAEDLAQEALVAALEQWPAEGVPTNPGAWLMATAKHRAIDGLRRDQVLRRKVDELGHQAEHSAEPDLAAQADDDIGDELLSLIFTTCHPVLSPESRVALTLRLIGALTTAEIASAFMVPEKTMAQRIVRAKRTLATEGVAIQTPTGRDRDPRMAAVLEVVYAIYNEGYAASAGSEWMRPELCNDALRLGRLLAGLAPDESEVQGLVALMEIQSSRAPARVGPGGEPVLLLDQDRGRWDWVLVGRGLAALRRAELLAGAPGDVGGGGPGDGTPRGDGGGLGPYGLQAAIAGCHARARTAGATDWGRIAELYGELASVLPSAVVALNHAVAVGMAEGPAAAPWSSTTYSRRCGAICWSGWARGRRPVGSSSVRRRSPRTNASEESCLSARPAAGSPRGPCRHRTRRCSPTARRSGSPERTRALLSRQRRCTSLATRAAEAWPPSRASAIDHSESPAPTT